MGRFLDLVTNPARSLGEYKSDKPSSPVERPAPLLKMNANESPYGPSPKAVAAMREMLEGSHLYPDDEAMVLRRKLAQAHNVHPEQIIISNGTTALLGVIARTLLRTGLSAVTSACSFISYPMVTRAAGAPLIETPLRAGGYDLDAMLAAIDGNTRLVFIANPNNPTGTLLDAAAISRFLESVPNQVIVVLDEAYYDYASYFATARGLEYSRVFDNDRAERNVVVLRTFSKAHGLAGTRIGYGIGPAVAQAAALAALEDVEHIQCALQNNAEQAEWLSREISSLGYDVAPVWTNFISLDIKQDARQFARRVRAAGVLIRPLTAWGAPTSVRVTIGTNEQNQKFLHAFQKALGK
jgi:histidinol-phosphate aminotransferase